MELNTFCNELNESDRNTNLEQDNVYLTWEKVIDEVLKSYSFDRKSENHKSLEISPSVEKSVELCEVGQHFSFQNRENEVKLLVETLHSMDRLRPKENVNRWELSKRDIKFPVVMSISGMGKTTFLRHGILKVLNDEILRSAVETKTDKEFLHRLDLYTIIRLDCSELLCLLRGRNVIYNVACLMIYEAFKHHIRSITRSTDFIGSLMHKGRNIPPLTIMDAIRLILLYFPDGLLVNVDDVSILGGIHVQCLLLSLGHCLLSGYKVLFCVCGVYNKDLLNDIYITRMSHKRIILPPLTFSHMTTILDTFFAAQNPEDVAVMSSNPYVKQLLWVVGGIPRFLEYLLQITATLSGSITEPARAHTDTIDLDRICRYLGALDADRMQEILSILRTKGIITGRGIDNQLRIVVMSSILSLCIAQLPVPLTLNLIPASLHRTYRTPYSVEDALHSQMMHLDSESRVHVPPILLHMLHPEGAALLDIAPPCTNITWEMKNFNVVQGHRHNETLLLSVLLHRVAARQLLGRSECCLSELLNIKLRTEHDVTVKLSEMTQLSYSLANCTMNKSSIAAEMESIQTGTAKVNKPTTAYTDGFCRLEKAVVYIQEKLSSTAKVDVAASSCDYTAPAVRDSSEEICAEEDKIPIKLQQQQQPTANHATLQGTTLPHLTAQRDVHITVFVIEGRKRPVCIKNQVSSNCYVVTKDQQAELFGDMVSKLRMYSIASHHRDTPVGRGNQQRKRRQRTAVVVEESRAAETDVYDSAGPGEHGSASATASSIGTGGDRAAPLAKKAKNQYGTESRASI